MFFYFAYPQDIVFSMVIKATELPHLIRLWKQSRVCSGVDVTLILWHAVFSIYGGMEEKQDFERGFLLSRMFGFGFFNISRTPELIVKI